MTRARDPDHEGFADGGGARIAYQVYGDGPTTVVLLATWPIVHSRIWKGQIHFLSRHFRVVAYDPRGNGQSDRPDSPEHYTWDRYITDALAVMDATQTDRAVVIGCSVGGHLGALLAARVPGRVHGAILIAPAAPIGPEHEHRFTGEFDAPPIRTEGWDKWNAHYWRTNYRDFIEFFQGQCCNEAHSTKQVEDMVNWALETTPDVLNHTMRAPDGSGGDEDTYRSIRCPTLIAHGDNDAIVPIEKSRYLASLCNARLIKLPDTGHVPQGRFPAKMNLVFKSFIEEIIEPKNRSEVDATRSGRKHGPKSKRALYLSSPIGLGHGRRDLAIARELRKLQPGLEIDWLAQHPVTALLDSAGERIHPASELLVSESRHIEQEADGHDLHAFEAYRRMDEILVANFMLFQEAVAQGDYDLVLGDEAWEVDYFWHEHPDLKKAAFVWFTDFVGFVPMPEKGERDVYLTSDYNAEMVDHVERYPGLRDRSIFVGNPADCIDRTMGPGLPQIRDWTERHFDFAGYIIGEDPRDFGSREQLREELGYGPDESVVIATVGGSGVGLTLLQRVITCFPMARQLVPNLRMIAVAGPRIAPESLQAPEGVEIHAYVPDLPRHLTAADLAIVQGGLTTCMELTAAGTPFIYVPLRNHFEQNFHVHHRLQRYHAGRRMDFEGCDPDNLAAAIADELNGQTDFTPVETGGAERAARMISELL